MKRICVAAILALTALSLAVPLRAYVIGISRTSAGEIVRHKWKSTAFPITWRMNPVQAANVTGTRTQAELFAASFAAWQSITTATVSFAQGQDTAATARPGDDGINLITTNTLASDLPAGVLAVTASSIYLAAGFDPTTQRTIDFAGQIAEADILFNSTVSFSTSATAVTDRIDLQSVTTHEIGHLLGLDHSPLPSATMFWSVAQGYIYPRSPSSDDVAGLSILYPSSLFAAKGKLSGVVRTTSNVPVYGAIVVAINMNGTPVASSVTDPEGAYVIEGLDAGVYTVYAEPLDGPITISNISSLTRVNPGVTVNTTFTTRSR
jgi:Matrixin/Carboxypeptidase regulatory-like domain